MVARRADASANDVRVRGEPAQGPGVRVEAPEVGAVAQTRHEAHEAASFQQTYEAM